jgi:hypothetical protein
MYKTEKFAIEAAKRDLRAEKGVMRGEYLVKNTSCECRCGQTTAVEVVMFRTSRRKNRFDVKVGEQIGSTVVGYCEMCGENE